MKNIELANELNCRGCSVTIEDLYHKKLGLLIDRGLRIITLCFDGSGRSRTVADQMNDLGVPAVRLVGGISQFVDGRMPSACIPLAQTVISSCPNVAVILTPEEMHRYYNFLSNLRASKYQNSKSAIESLKRMEL